MSARRKSGIGDLTSLQKKVVREIVAIVRREHRQRGDHLTEIQLAESVGTSRTPVQIALKHLAQKGLLSQDANRGYFMEKDAAEWNGIAHELTSFPDDPVYLRIAEDRRSGKLHEQVSENEMMRTYGIARGALRKLMARMSEEGWAEQNVGHGWSFLPLINSLEAYEESYLFRQAIEPAGILAATFRVDQDEWSVIREEQLRVINGGFKTMTPIELFEAARRFHETIARWSGNRFIAQSVRRVNLQRRLVEYHQAEKRKPRQTHAQEHILILDAIGKQNFVQAAALMRTHLDGARRNKSLSFS